MRRLSRKEFLRDAAVVSGAAWAGGLWLPAAVAKKASLDPAPFHFGVASGDPLADRVMIWTRVGSERELGFVPVHWEVALDADFAQLVARGIENTGPHRDHTVSVDVTGLEPGTTYHYRFEALGERSKPGRTRTAPERADDISFAIASCQSFPDGHYAAWRHIARRNLDFVLHLGDYIYEYGGSVEGFEEPVRRHRPNHEIVSLNDYRTRYANYRSDQHLRDAHAAHPFIAIWDDHEVANDRWRKGAENHQEEDEGDYEARREAAYRAYFEWMPIRRVEPGSDRIYRSFAFGELLDLFMLDTRTYRDRQSGTFPLPNVEPSYTDPDRTILGNAQERWFHSALSGSGARWRLVGTQVMIAHLKYGLMPDALAKPLQELTGQSKDGFPVNPDQWDGYQFDRTQIFELIRKRGIENTLFLTGDIHTSWANELKIDPDDPTEAPIAAEFVGPSITSANIDEIAGWPPRTGTRAIEAAAQANNPHVRYVELDSHGYVVVRAVPGRIRGDWYFVSDKKNPRAREERATSWVMRDGDATLVQPE